MQYKVDVEQAIVADLSKPSASKRYRTAFYSLTALSSIVLGALAMALIYHWNELQIVDKRLKAQDVKEVIRLTDALLTKHETNAANVAKLLTSFEHKLQSIESKLQSKKAATDFESNLTYDEAKQTGNVRVEMPGSTVSPNEANMRESNTLAVQTKASVPSVDTETAKSGSEESKQPESAPHDEKQSSESFRWEMSFPHTGWLKLSSSGINYGTASGNVVESEEQE